MDEFQQDFMRKVKNPTIEGEVVGAPGEPKKPIDKRWFVIGGLVLILVVTFVVLLIISNSSDSTVPATQGKDLPAGDPISEEEVTSTKWLCSYNATMTFYDDGRLVRITPTAESEFTYNIDGTKLTYGKSTGVIKDDIMTINHANGDQSTCHKEKS